MKVVLYSTGCPQCKVLKAKLEAANVTYELIEDTDIIVAKGFTIAPILEVDDEAMPFSQAIQWLRRAN